MIPPPKSPTEENVRLFAESVSKYFENGKDKKLVADAFKRFSSEKAIQFGDKNEERIKYLPIHSKNRERVKVIDTSLKFRLLALMILQSEDDYDLLPTLFAAQLDSYCEHYLRHMFSDDEDAMEEFYRGLVLDKDGSLDKCLQLCSDLFQVRIRNIDCDKDRVTEFWPQPKQMLNGRVEVAELIQNTFDDEKEMNFLDQAQEDAFFAKAYLNLSSLLDSIPITPKRTFWMSCDSFEIFEVTPRQEGLEVLLNHLRKISQKINSSHQSEGGELESEVKDTLLYCHEFFDQVGDDVLVSYEERERIDSRLDELDLLRVAIQGPDCAWKSLSHLVFFDSEEYKAMKDLVTAMFSEFSQHYEANRPLLSPFYSLKWSDYMTKVVSSGVSDSYILQAVADMFRVKVILVLHDNRLLDEFYPHESQIYHGTICVCSYLQHMEACTRKG